MTNHDMLLVAIMDRSSSMCDLVNSTVKGFNELRTDQIAQPGTCRLSLVLFDHELEVRYVARELSSVPPMTAGVGGDNPYFVRGSTALLDAIGTAVKGAEKWLGSHPSFGGQVKVAIFTDGYENASREWHLLHPTPDNDDRDIGGLIRWKQSEDWEFVFLGAGGKDWLEKSFGSVVTDPNAFYGYEHDAASTVGTYATVSNAITGSRAGGQSVSSGLRS